MSVLSRLKSSMQVLARKVDGLIEREVGQPCGFILFVWAEGEVAYVSSDNDRANAVKAMREILAKWDAEAALKAPHLRQ